MKRLSRTYAFGLLVILTGLLPFVAACGHANPPPSTTHGSVIEKKDTWLYSQKLEIYTKLDIEAKIMNVGSDGTITVYASAEPSDSSSSVREEGTQNTQVYLKQGEQITLHFYFWGHGTLTYRVWCFP
jgi:hypothetical protein